MLSFDNNEFRWNGSSIGRFGLISFGNSIINDYFLDPAYYYGSSLLEVVRATQNVFGGGVEEKVEGAKEEESKVEKGD